MALDGRLSLYYGGMRFERLFAVDPSLTCSGWAIFDIARGKVLGVGKIRSLAAMVPLPLRYKDIQRRVLDTYTKLCLGKRDVVVCESETTMRDPRAAFKVEHVRCTFEAVARSINVSVPGRINPRTVQSEVLGLRGKQVNRETVKSAAILIAKELFQRDLKALGFPCTDAELKKNQDIVDALLIGCLALSKIKAGSVAKQSLEEIFVPPTRARRRSRFGWGKGESNSFGWSENELAKFTGVLPEE